MPHIKYRLLYVTHAMTKKIYCYHRYAIAVGIVLLKNVIGIGILGTQILAETKCLRLKPGLLKFNKHKFKTTILLTHLRSKIDAEHGNLVTCAVGVFMLTHLNLHHFLLQKCRKHSLGNAVVLHKILEHRVINWVCNSYYHYRILFLLLQN